MTEKRKNMIRILKEYPAKKRKIALLKHEQAHPVELTDQEVIDAMAYSDPLAGVGGHLAQISDKTMQIALHFQSKRDYLHLEASREVSRELRVLLRETERLEFCLSQLDDVHEQVLRRHYFAKKTWPELEEEFSMSQRALFNRRDEALDELVEMYAYLERVTQGRRREEQDD